MDITSLIGLIIGLGGILFGNMIEGGHFSSLVQFAAAVIVLGGTAGAVALSSKKQDLRLGIRMVKKIFEKEQPEKIRKIINEITECAKLARRESILSIESRIPGMNDPFLIQVMRNVVDGVDPKVVREVFEKQIEIEEDKLLSAAKIWSEAGGYSPTIGIIGAVLGLIHVMGNLSDTSKLGSGIAVAFVATIYGVGLANLIFLPIGNKLKKKIADEMKIKEMIIEGGLCIQSGMTSTLVELKLRSYLESEAA